MNSYRKWVDDPWREMSSAARGISIASVIVVALVLDHAIGGWGGFLAGLAVAIVFACAIPACQHILQRPH